VCDIPYLIRFHFLRKLVISTSKEVYHQNLDHYDTMKPLTTIVIEKTLLDIGTHVYDKLVDRLNEKYHCYIHDCYEKPEYLKEVLKELYGKSHKAIIYSIENELKEFTHDKKTERFLQIMLK
jgi:hypothetical protein